MPPDKRDARPVVNRTDDEPATDQSASSLEVYGEGCEPASVFDARLLTKGIKSALSVVAEHIDSLTRTVRQAQASNVHGALGYPSWTAYVVAEFGDAPVRLDREHRQKLVTALSGEGMSARAIAPIVGASPATVKRDVAAGGSDEPPGMIVGLDGKSYVHNPKHDPDEWAKRASDAREVGESKRKQNHTFRFVEADAALGRATRALKAAASNLNGVTFTDGECELLNHALVKVCDTLESLGALMETSWEAAYDELARNPPDLSDLADLTDEGESE